MHHDDTLPDQERAYRDFKQACRIAAEAEQHLQDKRAGAEQLRCDLTMETARNEALGLGEIIYLD